MRYLLALLLLFASTAQAQTLCTKNLGALTERQFDNAYVSLMNKVDRELRQSGHYIYTDATKTVVVAYEATSSIDVTKLDRNVVNYTACKLNSIGIPTVLQTSGTKLFLVSRIYTVF